MCAGRPCGFRKFSVQSFDIIRVRQGLAQQSENVDMIQLADCSTHAGFLGRWRSAAQCKEHDMIDLRPATEGTLMGTLAASK